MAKPSFGKKETPLDYGALVKNLRDKGPEKLYLLWGEEDYLLADFVSRLRAACVGAEGDEFNAKRIDSPAPAANDIAEALDAMPFFGDRTFVELRGFDVNKCRDERTTALFADIPDWCTVVITLPTGMEPDGRLSFIKQLKSAGKAVNFTAQTGTPLNNWIARRFEANGKRIDRDAVDRLVFLSGDLMNRLIPEIAKICGYVPGDRVTAQDVEKLAHHIPEADAFQMTEEIARRITEALGGWGLFGVELFVRGDRVIFSEVSPRPHDTGMVTMISQDLSEFALHVRAVLGLPIPNIAFHGPSASRAVVVEGDTNRMEFANLENVLSEPDTQIRIFGKPEIEGHRRMAVLLARAESVEQAREKTARAYAKLQVNVFDRETQPK